MSEFYKREKLLDGVYFTAISAEKFKSSRLSVNFITNLSKDTASGNAIVPFILRKGCKKYSDFSLLNRKLADLYGASLSAGISKAGDMQVVSLDASFINDSYALEGESILKETAELMIELLLNPNVSDGSFNKDDVEIEKQALIDTIESEINDKRLYAMKSCMEMMFQNEPFGVSAYGYVDKAKEITGESAYGFYQNLLQKSRIEIVLSGQIDDTSVVKLFRDALSSINDRKPVEVSNKKSVFEGPFKEKTEEMELNQSKLVMGFKCVSDKTDETAMKAFSAIFGGTPFSKLFVNVREKMSLCYYCAARYDKLKNIMLVDSGVEASNKDKAYNEILAQLKSVAEGDFSEEDLTNTKSYLVGGYKSLRDSLSGTEGYVLSNILGGFDADVEKEIEAINALTKDDIISAAKSVELDAVYYLTGKETQNEND